MNYQRHPLEITPLVFGLVFLGTVAAWSLFELDVVSRSDAGWILPIVLIGAGALGVLLAATKPRRSREGHDTTLVAPEPWPTQTYAEPAQTYAEPSPAPQTGTGYRGIGETEESDPTEPAADTASFDTEVTTTEEHPTQDIPHEQPRERHDD